MTASDMITRGLAVALEAALPGVYRGVSVGKADNRKSWEAHLADDATPAERAQAQAIIDAFDPGATKPPRVVSFAVAIDRLTDAKWSDLQTAIGGDVRLARWYERAKMRGSIDLESAETKTALAALISTGLFTKQGLSTIFAAAVK